MLEINNMSSSEKKISNLNLLELGGSANFSTKIYFSKNFPIAFNYDMNILAYLQNDVVHYVLYISIYYHYIS